MEPGLWKVPSYGKPRTNRAPSHSSWKTPMQPAFSTPPTAPASDPKKNHSEIDYPQLTVLDVSG